MEDYERDAEEDEHFGIDHLKAEAANDSALSSQERESADIDSQSKPGEHEDR